MYKSIFFTFITTSNFLSTLNFFYLRYITGTLQADISWTKNSTVTLLNFSKVRQVPQYQLARTQKPSLLKSLLKILLSAFHQVAFYWLECLYLSMLHQLSSNDIINLNMLCQFTLFLTHMKPYTCDILLMISCMYLHWSTYHSCS